MSFLNAQLEVISSVTKKQRENGYLGITNSLCFRGEQAIHVSLPPKKKETNKKTFKKQTRKEQWKCKNTFNLKVLIKDIKEMQ